MLKRLLILLLLYSACCCSPAIGQSIFPARLTTLEGEPAAISPVKSAPLTVFVFLLPDCPACQSYIRTLSDLQKKHASSGVRFLGVFAGKFSKKEEMLSFRKQFNVTFPLYVDVDHSLIRQLSVNVSPETVVVDPSGRVRYQGRIDDWMYAVGKKRSVIRNHDLDDALCALIKGVEPEPARTVPIGCIIE